MASGQTEVCTSACKRGARRAAHQARGIVSAVLQGHGEGWCGIYVYASNRGLPYGDATKGRLRLYHGGIQAHRTRDRCVLLSWPVVQQTCDFRAHGCS